MAYKKYAYYNKGNKVAIIELESASENSPTEFTRYISPKTAVTDGLEIEYAYAPTYNIEDADDTKVIGGYAEDNGLLKLTLASSSHTKDDWVLIEGSNKISGLHQVNTTTSSSTSLILNTKYNGDSISESSTLYQDVTFIQDESFELDLSDYQAQAVVYYVKAKIAEDMRDMEGREYFLKLFRKQMEKSSRAKKRGLYKMQGFWGMRK